MISILHLPVLQIKWFYHYILWILNFLTIDEKKKLDWLTDWLILTACQPVRLFCAKKLKNCIHCMFIYTFVSKEVFFAHGPTEYELFLNRSIRPIDRSITDTTNLDQSGTGSNENERVHSRSLKLEPYHQMQFSVMLTRSLSFRRILPLCRG